MDIHDRVRVIGNDKFMANREGRVHSLALDKHFNLGWRIKLDGAEGVAFFLESELEVVEPVNNPNKQEAKGLPAWWDNLNEIRMMLYQVEVEHESVRTVFGPYFGNLGEVYLHLQKIQEKNND